MGHILSKAQIEKYAARLQGQRLLPLFRDWQVKRAIKRLTNDGTQASIDALKLAVEKGILRTPHGGDLLQGVLEHSVSPLLAKRVRAHLKPPKEVIVPHESPPEGLDCGISSPSQSQTQPQPQPHPPQQLQSESQAEHEEIAERLPETFSSTSNPIRMLKEYLDSAIPLESYRVEVRERVQQDLSQELLQKICELWDQSGEKQCETLRTLIEFIDQVPERPLWLRRKVAFECNMVRQLADDGPSFAQHLIAPGLLRTHRTAVLNTIRQLRRDDTKAEICSIWHEFYRYGVCDRDFDEILLEMDFLPQSPPEQRVAIALTCRWAERLALDDCEILPYLLGLLDDYRLGAEAKRALEINRNLSFQQALKEACFSELSNEYSQQASAKPIAESIVMPLDVESEQASPSAENKGDVATRKNDEDLSEKVPTQARVAVDELLSRDVIFSEHPSARTSDLGIDPQDFGNSIRTGDNGDTIIDEELDSIGVSEASDGSNLLERSNLGASTQAARAKAYLDYKLDIRDDTDWNNIAISAIEIGRAGDADAKIISRIDQFLEVLSSRDLLVGEVDNYVAVYALSGEGAVEVERIELLELMTASNSEFATIVASLSDKSDQNSCRREV